MIYRVGFSAREYFVEQIVATDSGTPAIYFAIMDDKYSKVRAGPKPNMGIFLASVRNA